MGKSNPSTRRAYLRGLRDAEKQCRDIADRYMQRFKGAANADVRADLEARAWAANLCASSIAALREPRS